MIKTDYTRVIKQIKTPVCVECGAKLREKNTNVCSRCLEEILIDSQKEKES